MIQFLTYISLMFSTPQLFASDTTALRTSPTLNSTQARQLIKLFNKRPKQPWQFVVANELVNVQNKELIDYGIKILSQTVATIGPKAKNKSKRYSGNSLNCTSCHLKGNSKLPGTKYYAMPFTNLTNDYPRFQARSMRVLDIPDRVNGCMTRSMGSLGKLLPHDSREMKALLAYFKWISQNTKKNQSMEGTGLPALVFPNRKANIDDGQQVYFQFCKVCHSENGSGQKSPNYQITAQYLFPPVAGPDSFNNGAGISRLKKATRFIYANMPPNATSTNPLLTIDQAYDAASFILSLPRETMVGRKSDFPNPSFRPDDYPVPEYFSNDENALNKSRIGPYKKSTFKKKQHKR